MITYTEVYNKGLGIKDISASRFYFLSVCNNLKHTRKRNRNKYNFIRHFQKSHFDYIVFNTKNI